MLQQRRSSSEKFLMPAGRLEANSKELGLLKKNMLAHHYDRQIQQKQLIRQRSLVKENPQNRMNPRQLSFKEMTELERDYDRSLKTNLAKQYQQIMAENEMRKKIEREQKLSEELRVREGIASLEKEEKAKGELAYMRNREDMLEHMRKMERNEQERKKQRELEKEEFNNKYNSLPEPNKQRTFQEHYRNVELERERIERDYLSKWSPVIRSRDQEKDRFIERHIQRGRLFEDQTKRKQALGQLALVNNLRETLAEQVKMKSLQKEVERHRGSEGYTSSGYQNVHHPINNPIDFKITHDNKYILQQLREQRQGQMQMSGLARNGSHALL